MTLRVVGEAERPVFQHPLPVRTERPVFASKGSRRKFRSQRSRQGLRLKGPSRSLWRPWCVHSEFELSEEGCKQSCRRRRGARGIPTPRRQVQQIDGRLKPATVAFGDTSIRPTVTPAPVARRNVSSWVLQPKNNRKLYNCGLPFRLHECMQLYY